MLEFEPFSTILGTDMSAGVIDLRPARNIALLTQVVGKFEYLHHIDVLSAKRIDHNTDWLFNFYLRLLFDGGISEYENDAEYAPSGCVSFLTIHQSKGMEFPIVFVDSLGNNPRKSCNELIQLVGDKYFKRRAFEPHDQTKYFDFWRLYYTAFSRAQDLLVLTCNEDSRTPSMYFREVYNDLIDAESAQFDISEFDFKDIKEVNLKDTFSFTSHITVYETCSLQYKFYKELEFEPVRVNAMLFGMLIHQTIEDIHRAALRHEEHLIIPDNIVKWLDTNYTSLTKTERTYLAEPQKNAALKQVLRYAQRQSGQWHTLKDAEVDVSLVKPDYIIEGKIDLIKGVGNTVDIVDFKSEKKPDIFNDAERLRHYQRQLQVYAHLVEERTGQKVSQMHLYYTGEESGVPTISFSYQKSAVDSTIQAFDDTVHKILRREFNQRASSPKVCNECDFRFYCAK
jgi:DNA helicase-2/ATP-dependent DNA helicase PcrA